MTYKIADVQKLRANLQAQASIVIALLVQVLESLSYESNPQVHRLLQGHRRHRCYRFSGGLAVLAITGCANSRARVSTRTGEADAVSPAGGTPEQFGRDDRREIDQRRNVATDSSEGGQSVNCFVPVPLRESERAAPALAPYEDCFEATLHTPCR